MESKANDDLVTRITAKLETWAVPMDVREFSRKEYREVFPQGTVKTPIGEVKIGKNQFEKMAEKDNGKRRALIGAMWQTLTDPITIIQEEKDGRKDIKISTLIDYLESLGFGLEITALQKGDNATREVLLRT